MFDVNYLEYYGIIKASKCYLSKLQIKPEKHNQTSTTQISVSLLCNTSVKISQMAYSIMLNIEYTSKAAKKWSNVFDGELDWNKIYSLPNKTTKDTKLRWFQYRLLHRILTTNRFLKIIGIKEDDICQFCNTEVETLTHLFWECVCTAMFWTRLVKWLKDNCILLGNLELSKE